MNKNLSTYFIIICFIVLIVGLFIWKQKAQKPDPRAEVLAKCLAENKAAMYGAYWCSHCQNQKNMFGAAFKYVPYIECTEETQKCVDADVKGYPTWIFASGQKLEGVQSFDKLAETAGCDLPAF